MDQKNAVTVLGLGNILLGDEGFGVRFVQWFGGRWTFPEGVAITDGGTLGFGLLDAVTSTRHLIVIDVIKIDEESGSIFRFTREEMSSYLPGPTSAHEVEFVDVLSMAELMGRCPSVVFLAVVPKKYGTMEVGITDEMVQRFSDVERLLLKELLALGISPERERRCTN